VSAPTTTSPRLHHLDALRSFCMVFGVFVHATTLFDPRILTAIPLASDYFRMAAFFAVSGFFAGMLGARMTWRELLTKRSVALLLPFFTVLVLLNPITNYLIYLRHNPWMAIDAYFYDGWRVDARGPGVWHLHLWFLLSLWSYFLVLPLIRWLLATRLADMGLGLIERLPPWLRVTAIGLIVAAAVFALRAVYAVVLSGPLAPTPFAWIARATVQYLPLFALGVALYGRPSLWQAFQRIDPLGLLIGGGAVALTMHFETQLGGRFDAVLIAAKFLLITAIVAALFAIFARFFGQPRGWVSALTDAMYTIYLTHYVIVYALALLLAPLITNSYALYAVVVTLALGISYALHRLVVRRSALLSWTLNGRPRRPA
jgi:glucans biosynthesis protein C